MVTCDPRIDAYLDKAPEFARAILAELRKRMHVACPDVAETIKWRHPSFEHHGLLGGMAAFKAHCSFGFWKEALLRQDQALAGVVDRVGRMSSVADLPSQAAFTKLVRRAMQLNAAGAVPSRRPARVKAPLALHPDLRRALDADARAKAQFEMFAPSHRREYLDWIADAKRDETRQRRIEQAIAWIAAGKHRNWKYERC